MATAEGQYQTTARRSLRWTGGNEWIGICESEAVDVVPTDTGAIVGFTPPADISEMEIQLPPLTDDAPSDEDVNYLLELNLQTDSAVLTHVGGVQGIVN